jgi:acyl-lipid omega-6 desaturase (Delta-12 desaturase)
LKVNDFANLESAQHYAELKQTVRDLSDHCRSFTTQLNGRALWQLSSTSLLFALFFAAVVANIADRYWVTLLLAVPAGGLLVRLFLLQHDCGHGSFFSSKNANVLVGRLLSLLTFTPFSYWQTTHAMHHASAGNLQRRGFGDVSTLTIQEYGLLSNVAKLRYRLLRSPIVSLVIGPPVHFLILQRIPGYMKFVNLRSLTSIILHDFAIVGIYGLVIYLFGLEVVVFGFMPIVIVASWIGALLFNIQHQFEETYWEDADKWDLKVAALKGSSHLQLPSVLNWFTCDIGLHHVHHLSSRIPNYRLRACMAQSPNLQSIAPKLTLWNALGSIHLGLWDDSERRLISFGEFNTKYA